MRHLVSALVIALLLIGGATLAWGWPGAYGIGVVIPAALLGTAVAHGIEAWMGRSALRFGFSVLAAVLGSAAAIGSLLVMWAATAPAEVTIEVRRSVDVPPAIGWSVIAEPTRWTRWNALLADLEPIGTASDAIPGARFRTSWAIGGQVVPAEHVVADVEDERELRFRVALAEGTAIEEVQEGVSMEPRAGPTVLTYRLQYRTPTVAARAVDRVVLRPSFELLAEQTITRLAAAVEKEGAGG